ncbi:MAG: GDP-mannose 4,6-dehydratase [Candidatus Omnitrophica bacterium]|nr:GDP-mannose 4,6-dehydratase [Candidatus Omnitrophota bacterium]
MAHWKNRAVLVTGATGLLGSNLTGALVAGGARVVALVRDEVLDSALKCSGDWEKIIRVHGDLSEQAQLERILADYSIDFCFHLAAQTIVGVANDSPVATFESNIRGTWNLLEAARRYGKLKAIVVASSDKAYGMHPAPYDETTALAGRFPYDVSKSCADLIAQSYGLSYGLPVGITRCGNLYGGGDFNFSRIIPGSIQMIVDGKDPVIRSDGSHLRDYLYVSDAVSGYLGLADALAEGKFYGEAFNFGTSRPVSVLDLVRLLLEVSGRKNLKPDIQGTSKAAREIDAQWLDSKKASEKLSWRPSVSLEEGLQLTFNWYEQYLKWDAPLPARLGGSAIGGKGEGPCLPAGRVRVARQ